MQCNEWSDNDSNVTAVIILTGKYKRFAKTCQTGLRGAGNIGHGHPAVARATTGKAEIIAAMQEFHGKTMGALAATWGRVYQKPFAPMLQGLKHVPYNNFEKLHDTINGNTAAVILEPAQNVILNPSLLFT